MTTTTRRQIICACGHTGFVIFSENDAPFSKGWESYDLQGFEGNRLYEEPYFKGDELLALAPVCPECGQQNKVKYA